jgi:hypothetical protein
VANIIDLLSRLAGSKTPMSEWYGSRILRRHENPLDHPPWRDTLDRFMRATMDEVRLQLASELASQTLKLSAFDEVIPFREAVLRREAGADISYDKQRDHSAHTITNWLLGWLIYENSESLRNAMKEATEARGLGKELKRNPVEAFGDVWTYASILHDIGYLFEGGIARLSWEPYHETARRGALVVNDFFYNRIWHEWGVTCAADRQLIRESGYRFLTLPTEGTLGGIIEGLQQLGGLEPLLRDVSAALPNGNPPNVPGNHVNAFELWEAHYGRLGKQAMVERVRHTQQAFADLAYTGLPNVGIRVIDHGVASGLLLLQLITMYYGARSALSGSTANWVTGQSRTVFMGSAGGVDYKPLFWWSGILWGTFATAVHNVQQTMRWKAKLTLEDDPLAYLGILVDSVQEWDRYAVQRGAVLARERALQGIDVGAALTDKGQLRLTLPKARRGKVKADLDVALEGWERFVELPD